MPAAEAQLMGIPMTDDYDSPWKDILEAYFPDFMTLFFPPGMGRPRGGAGGER
jgi:hypothetical protein